MEHTVDNQNAIKLHTEGSDPTMKVKTASLVNNNSKTATRAAGNESPNNRVK